jgi:hypothetical protein
LLLKQFDELLNRENLNDKMIGDLIQCVKNIRIMSINVVNYFTKIREICSYNVLGGKYNLEKINKIYLYDRNYLIKMKYDLDFLTNSKLNKYFNFCEESDPFLVSLNDPIKMEESKDSEKMRVPISEEMINAIKQCQLVILQDLLYYQVATIKNERNSR